MEGLRSLLIDSSFIHDILKLNVQPSDSDYAVDIRSPAVYVSLQTYRDVLCMYSFYTGTFHPSNNNSCLILLYTQQLTAVNNVCSLYSGSIIWRRMAGTPRGPRPCRSSCVPLSQESSDRFARISTTWCALRLFLVQCSRIFR